MYEHQVCSLSDLRTYPKYYHTIIKIRLICGGAPCAFSRDHATDATRDPRPKLLIVLRSKLGNRSAQGIGGNRCNQLLPWVKPSRKINGVLASMPSGSLTMAFWHHADCTIFKRSERTNSPHLGARMNTFYRNYVNCKKLSCLSASETRPVYMTSVLRLWQQAKCVCFRPSRGLPRDMLNLDLCILEFPHVIHNCQRFTVISLCSFSV